MLQFTDFVFVFIIIVDKEALLWNDNLAPLVFLGLISFYLPVILPTFHPSICECKEDGQQCCGNFYQLQLLKISHIDYNFKKS